MSFLREIYDVFDEDKDGYISCIEIKTILAKFGFEHSLKDIDEMIQEKDLDQDGRINFDEFVNVMKRDVSSIGILLLKILIIDKMMEVKQAFDLCDTSLDGRIDKNELKMYFSKLSISISDKEIDNMMHVADTNHSGYIEFEEFIKIMS